MDLAPLTWADLAAATPQKPLRAAARVAVLDGSGKVLFESDLR